MSETALAISLFPPYLRSVNGQGERSEGLAVSVLQLAFSLLPEGDGLVVTGIFDEETCQAVRGFQDRYGVDDEERATCSVGPNTFVAFHNVTGIDLTTLPITPFRRKTQWIDHEGVPRFWPQG